MLKDSGIKDMLTILGPENSLAAKNSFPHTIRALYGKDNLRNAVHASESPEYAAKESDFFFNQGPFSGRRNCQSSAVLTNCSLLLMKPHIIQSKQVGAVIDRLLSIGGFEISALQMFHLNKGTACEFFELYKGIMPEFNSMTDYVATGGPVIACEIRQEDVV